MLSSQVLLYHLHYILSAVPKLNFPVKTGGLARSKSYQAQETGVAIFEEATRSLQSTSAENMPGRSFLCRERHVVSRRSQSSRST